MTALHTANEVAAVIRSAERPGRRTVTGIVGAPGSGKSTLAAEVVTLLGPRAVVLPMDGFHLPQVELVALDRRNRMGAHDTFDVDELVRVLDRLVDSQNSEERVLAPGFDRESEEPIPDAIEIPPEIRTIVVEGNYLLLNTGGWERVARFLDLTFAIELDHDIRLKRLIARHERYGKSPDEARDWARGTDETNSRLIETTVPRADHVVRL